jgi:hypothetical protein
LKVARIALAFLIAAASSSPACWGQDQMTVAKLTEAIARKMVPLVKMAAETRTAMQASQADAFANVGDLFVASGTSKKLIVSGQDVLEAIRSDSDQAYLPPGLTFLPLTSKGWYDSTGTLFAAFTFGIKGDEVLLGYFEKMQTDPLNEKWAGLFIAAQGEDSPERRASLAMFKKVDAFYRGKGFKVIGTKDGIKYFWQSPDGVVFAAYDYFNDLSRVAAKAGEKVGSGPLVTLLVSPRMEGPKPVADPMPAALEKAGMTQEEFTGYLNALLLARADQPREAELDSPDMPGLPELPPDAPKEAVDQLNEAKAAYAKSMGPLLAIRKANLGLYKKRSSELEAPLAALSQ